MTGADGPTTGRVELRDGTRLHTATWDPAAERGPAFLLVHGLASNASLWDGVGHGLAAAGHRAVAVDQRSHGRSDPSDELDLDTLTTDLLEVIAAHELGAPIVVGQSWGGNVVVALAAAHPDRIRAAVAIDGGTIELGSAFSDLDAAWSVLAPPDWDARQVPFARLAADSAARHPGWPDAGRRAQLANLAVRADGTATAILRREHHRAIVAQMLAHRPLDQLARVEVPVLLLPVAGGESSWAAGKRAGVERAVASNPLVRVRWIEGRSHDVHAEAPDEVTDELVRAAADGRLGAPTPDTEVAP